MKTIITIIACSLLFLGCGKEARQKMSSTGFTVGSSREAIVKHLEQIHARILKDRPELLHAEFSTSDLKRPMQVELGFANGTLDSVNYIPQ